MKAALSLLVTGLALVAHAPSWAQSSPSLGQARSGVIHGTSPGITIIPSRNKAASQPAPAAAPASAASTPGGAAAPAAAAPAPAATSKPAAALGSLLRSDEPLSGTSMNSAARLTSPSIGIVLPTAASASSAASAPKR